MSVLELYGSQQSVVMGCCEHDNEHRGSENFLIYFREYYFLKEDPVPHNCIQGAEVMLLMPLLQETQAKKPHSSAANNMRHLLQFPMVMMEAPPSLSPVELSVSPVAAPSKQQSATRS
jgi:hypothetical protein